VKICKTHSNYTDLYKVLEWLSRITGIILTATLLINNSTPEEPLFSRDFIMILAVFLPLIFGGILSLIFRNAADNAKGISYLGKEGIYNKYSAKNPDWIKMCYDINISKE
jgi:hypothetical protein